MKSTMVDQNLIDYDLSFLIVFIVIERGIEDGVYR